MVVLVEVVLIVHPQDQMREEQQTEKQAQLILHPPKDMTVALCQDLVEVDMNLQAVVELVVLERL